ncbi:mechanosensitive ion channel family protein [Collinsella sp. AGMB00827]|uniref:Mechanosensitive ion channel family protein n=1 Tax=Collinsella ureilytica TaxID=2869515 RepID=A0ABS7MIN0_9ACTN|nr:mechanosensitive ion channel domain-containing protein [Collinsella urealyticum]MBY4797173.1 mechanosensitive ion channel family protein [Collinsella urealyticum]
MQSGTAQFHPIQNMPWGHNVLIAAGLVLATLILSRLSARALRHLLWRKDNQLPTSTIIVNIARVAIWATSGSIILDSCFGISANALVAALGIGGLAVSLGFQNTLSNLISGITITFTGLVKPGDDIEVGLVSGTVQDVTWRHTTIRNREGRTVIVPNAMIASSVLVRIPQANMVKIPISIPLDRTSHAEAGIDEFAGNLAEAVSRAVEPISSLEKEPRVIFSEITRDWITGSLILFIHAPERRAAATDAAVRAIASTLHEVSAKA